MARWRTRVFVWGSWCFDFLVEVSLRLRVERRLRAMDVVLDDCSWSRGVWCVCVREDMRSKQRIVTNIHAPLK